MVDNQHKQIKGYRDLPQSDIDAMNRIKVMETEVGKLWRAIQEDPAVTSDGRWLSIAKTHFEEGFSAFVRSVARPDERF